MQALCKSDKVNVFLLNKIYLSKDQIALIVVLLDLGISFLMYLSFVYLRAMQKITAAEVDEAVVTAADFAVQIKTLPSNYANLKDLKAKLWYYAQNVVSKEQRLDNPKDKTLDQN